MLAIDGILFGNHKIKCVNMPTRHKTEVGVKFSFSVFTTLPNTELVFRSCASENLRCPKGFKT